jgi:hypothetical protein
LFVDWGDALRLAASASADALAASSAPGFEPGAPGRRSFSTHRGCPRRASAGRARRRATGRRNGGTTRGAGPTRGGAYARAKTRFGSFILPTSYRSTLTFASLTGARRIERDRRSRASTGSALAVLARPPYLPRKTIRRRAHFQNV